MEKEERFFRLIKAIRISVLGVFISAAVPLIGYGKGDDAPIWAFAPLFVFAGVTFLLAGALAWTVWKT